jgi:acyl-CoA thioester hydrolase
MVENGVIVAHLEIDYVSPLSFRLDPVAVDLWVGGIGGSTFELCYEVLEGGEEASEDKARVYARASTTLVAFDLQGARPRRLLPEERERLESWLDDPIVFRRWRGIAS